MIEHPKWNKYLAQKCELEIHELFDFWGYEK